MRSLWKQVGCGISVLPSLWQGGEGLSSLTDPLLFPKMQGLFRHNGEGFNLDDNTLLGHLEELAHSLSIQIRYEPLKREGSFASGGLCKLRGEYVLIINSNVAIKDRIQAIANSVNRFDLTKIYFRPGIRKFLDSLPKRSEPIPKLDSIPVFQDEN